MTIPLSPAAQAVLDAAASQMEGGWISPDFIPYRAKKIAAALRAAADQVVPEPPVIVEGGRTYEEAWTATVHDDIRRRFLAIADELEGANG
jgi:hypothetical protein